MTALHHQHRHPAIELAARYRAVFGAAWQCRHEALGPKRLAEESAFLPAALAIQETPVHPAPRRATWAIMALFAFTIAWACIGKVDIVAIAPGRIVVTDGTKLIQPLETSVVRAIHVRDGDAVAQGQVLIELDPTAAAADSQAVRAQVQTAEDEEARAKALLQALQDGAAPKPLRDSSKSAHLRAEWADMAAKLAKLDAEAARRRAELATAQGARAKLQSTLPMAERREAELNDLARQGFVSAHAGQDRTRERVEMERDLATLQARVAEAEAAVTESGRSMASYRAEAERSLNERLTKARSDLLQLQQQDTKSKHREGLTLLRAPIGGRVQQLAVHSTGGVVTAAQPLLVVVPLHSTMTAEVVFENKDIGFVSVGQQASLKLDTFPFTKYGTIEATVQVVSTDAVLDEKKGAVFPAVLTLQRGTIALGERNVPLAPGMSLVAEVRTGSRRVIEYLFSPVARSLSESLSER